MSPSFEPRSGLDKQLASKRLDQFFGMSTDREPQELSDGEWTNLLNCRNNILEGIRKRLGGRKVFSETHTTGAKVWGLHTFIDDANTETYIKIVGTEIYKSTGGAWTQITGTVTAADTYFATLGAIDTGAASSDTGTSTSGSSLSITNTGKAYTKNVHVGRILSIANEKKLIGANSATIVYVKEAFDETPSTTAYTIYPRATEFFFANGTEFWKCDGTTLTNLSASVFAYPFTGIEQHQGRIFGWKGTRLHWSDLGVGEHFAGTAWQDFETPILRAKSIAGFLVVYEANKVTYMSGDSPSTFSFKVLFPNIGLIAPKSVANYYGAYQMFLSRLGVIVISADSLKSDTETSGDKQGEEPINISVDYLQLDIDTQSTAHKAAACGEVFGDNYMLCIDDDWYVLNLRSSAKTNFRRWVWSKDDRPDAMDANCLGQFGTRYVAGAQDNGQVYELEVTNADDGTAIVWTMERERWNPTGKSDRKRFWSLNMTQEVGASSTMSYYVDPEGSTYGAAIKSISLLTATDNIHKIKIPGNPSDVKNIGRDLSIKISEASTASVGEIQEMQLLYYPSLVE